MLRLPLSLAAWNTPDFSAVLKQEIERRGAAALPLQRGLANTSYALDEPFSVMIIGVADTPTAIAARVGVFFSGLTAGCNCAGDPTPVEPQNEYCELRLRIDKATATTEVALAD